MAEVMGADATATSQARGAESESGRETWLPSRNWGWFIARGVLLCVLGVIALLAPGPALFGFAMVFAAFSFVDGIFAVICGVRGARNKADRWVALLLSGLFGIGIGVLFVLFPLVSTFAFAFATVLLIAAWAVARGIFEIAAAIRLRKTIRGEWLLALSGALSLLLGLIIVYLLAVNPGISVLSVAWLIGIYALVSGVALIILGFRLRKSAR